MTAGTLPFQKRLPATTGSAQDTRDLGQLLAADLVDGHVLALHGDLGAGKTELVKGLVAGLGGNAEDVSSPTFTIAHEYALPEGYLLHVDAYRAESEKEFIEMGLSEYILEARVTAIEWPERMGAELPLEAISIHIRHLGGDLREVVAGQPE